MENLTPAQRYYQTHKEAKKQYGREYYHNNKERILKSIKEKKVKAPEILVPVAASPLDAFRGRGKPTVTMSCDEKNTIVYFN
jgi:hypothetical protein